MASKPRWLCVCDSGSVRSVTLARMLKKYGAETLPVGIKDNSSQTVEVLSSWADRIYVAEERMADYIPAEYRHKVSIRYICGPDFWYTPGHPDLVTLYREKLEHSPPAPLGEPKAE